MASPLSLLRTSLTLALLCNATLLQAGTPQSIVFRPPQDRILGIPGLALTASATSGLPVQLSTTTPTVCRISGGLLNTLTAGTCTITATQAGSAIYNPATPVTQSLAVRSPAPTGALRPAQGSPVNVPAIANTVFPVDLNGDGIPDLITLNTAANSIAILLGDGTGSFTPAAGSPVTTGQGPSSVAAGDFNGDGLPDLAITNSSGASLTILLGNGSGGFAAATSSPLSIGAGSVPNAVAAGDFNNDGLTDLAVADRANNLIVILLGTGSGGFTASRGSPVLLNGQSGPVSILTADFDGDGVPDLATANQVSGSISILLGNGGGGFSTAPGNSLRTASQPLSLTCGDFNGDGIPDIAAAAYAGNSISVFLGRGNGVFDPAAGSPIAVNSPWMVTAADINGDGMTDLLAASAGDGLLILLGNGLGSFTNPAPKAFPSLTNPVSIAVADFNLDLSPDLAVITYNTSQLTILKGGLALTTASLSTTAASTVPYGKTVALTLSVAGLAGTFVPLAGTASFADNGTVTGMATQTLSPFTFTANNLAGGSHTFAGAYSGGAGINGAVGSLPAIQVTGAPPAVLTALSPASAVAGTTGLTLTLAGTGFVASSQVYWNKSALQTTYLSPGKLTAAVPDALLLTSATVTIGVLNGGSTLSNTISFAITTFTLTALTPSSATVGTAALQVCATGTGFVSGAVMQWNGAPLATTYTSSTQLCGTVPATLLSAPAKAFIAVINPDGMSTGTLPFPVTLPVPVIAAGGVVPLYSSTPVIQPGSWISIYGTDFAKGTFTWAGDFPAALGGVSVTINKKPGYLWSVTPTQVNLQAPDDTTTGKVNVVLTNANGSASATVTLAAASPSFCLLPGSQYAASVIPTPDGTGTYGGGTYDLMGPLGAFGFKTRPVHPGETLVLYGVGFGPTKPVVPAGIAFAGAAPTTTPVTITLGGIAAKVLFAGMTSAGLYQINVIVPTLATGDQTLIGTVGTATTPSSVVISVAPAH